MNKAPKLFQAALTAAKMQPARIGVGPIQFQLFSIGTPVTCNDIPGRRLLMSPCPIEDAITDEEQVCEALTPWDDAWTDIGGEG